VRKKGGVMKGQFWRFLRACGLCAIVISVLGTKTGLEAMTVCPYPPGTSKWNNIEHRLFAFISQNWPGRPLVSYAVVLRLIAAATAKTGLQATSYLDTNVYPTGMTATRTTRKRVPRSPGDPLAGVCHERPRGRP
jgi:hypothetical protein